MYKTRKFILLSIIMLILVYSSNGVFASDKIKVIINDCQQSFTPSPIIQNGSTLVPMRAFFEALGAEIQWDNTRKTVIATRNNIVVELTINQKTVRINNNIVSLSVPGKIINGNTFIPLRFVGEALGDSVNWNSQSSTITITSTVKIGLNLELSGPVGEYGILTKTGIELAVEEINKTGGVLNGLKLEALKVDNMSNALEAASAQERLIKEGIVASIGPLTSRNTFSAGDVAMEYHVPLITCSATNPNVTVDESTGLVKNYVFRSCFIDPYQGTAAAKFIYNTLGIKKAAIMEDVNSDYSKNIINDFKSTYNTLGGQIVSDTFYSTGENHYSSQLEKIKSCGAEVIFLPGYYNDVAVIVRSAREMDMDIPIVGCDGWDSPNLAVMAGADNLNNTFFTNHFSIDDQDPIVQAFVTSYQNKYGEKPSAFAALGYEAAYLIADAINRAGDTNPENIKNALANTKGLMGLMGSLTIDQYHNPTKDVFILENINGKAVFKKRILP